MNGSGLVDCLAEKMLRKSLRRRYRKQTAQASNKAPLAPPAAMAAISPTVGFFGEVFVGSATEVGCGTALEVVSVPILPLVEAVSPNRVEGVLLEVGLELERLPDSKLSVA
jgi:hypothetical protein